MCGGGRSSHLEDASSRVSSSTLDIPRATVNGRSLCAVKASQCQCVGDGNTKNTLQLSG